MPLAKFANATGIVKVENQIKVKVSFSALNLERDYDDENLRMLELAYALIKELSELWLRLSVNKKNSETFTDGGIILSSVKFSTYNKNDAELLKVLRRFWVHFEGISPWPIIIALLQTFVACFQ